MKLILACTECATAPKLQEIPDWTIVWAQSLNETMPISMCPHVPAEGQSVHIPNRH